MVVRPADTVQSMSTSPPEEPGPEQPEPDPGRSGSGTPEDSTSGQSVPQQPEEDFERRWSEITERLGPLADPAAPGPRDYTEEILEDEERFIPPDPGPLLPRNPRNVLPWTGAVGGPMAVLIILVFWPTAPPWAYYVALAATITGLLTIWWRLPQRRDDTGGDNGAVV